MLTREFDGKSLCEQLELARVIGDIMQTVFTKTKGIWQIEISKTQVVEAMCHIMEILEKYKDKFPDKERYPVFLYPRVLNTFDIPATYAKTLISGVEITDPNSNYDQLPNAWTRGPPRNTVANTQNQNKYQTSPSNKQQTANNNSAKKSNDNKEIQHLRNKLKGIEKKFDELTQLISKTCAAQKVMVDAVQTTVESVTTNNNALCTDMGDITKNIAIKELSNSKLNNITIDTPNSIIKSTITGDTYEQDATKHDDKDKSTSEDNTDPMVSLSQTLTDAAKDTQSESKSDKEDEVEQLAQNKKKSETLTKAALIQRRKSV
eukprot:5645486-Ditylum_brightwellii.AAC.1